MTYFHSVSCAGTFLLISSNPETGRQRLLMHEQPSSGTVHVWCESVRDEGSSKLCLLGSSGLLWGRDAYLPDNAAASKLLSKFSMVPDISH